MNPIAATAGAGVATVAALHFGRDMFRAPIEGADWYRSVVRELRQRTGFRSAGSCVEVYNRHLAAELGERGPGMSPTGRDFPGGYTNRELRELATLWIQAGHEGLGLEGLIGAQGGAAAAGEALDALDDRRDALPSSGSLVYEANASETAIAGVWRAMQDFARACDQERTVELELEESRGPLDYAGQALAYPFRWAADQFGGALGELGAGLVKAGLVVGAALILVMAVTR